MYQGDVQFVLRCGQCNKPFDKQSMLKRHGYYCRSRRAGSTTRPRSCISCAKRKARCDNRLPGCSRCIAKTIECHYPANTSRGAGSGIQCSGDASIGRRKTVPASGADFPSLELREQATIDDDAIFDSTLVTADPEIANLDAEHFDWNDPGIDFAEFLNPEPNDETVQYPSSGPPSLISHSIPSTDQTVLVQQATSSSNVSIPTVPSYTIRSLVHRPRVNTVTQRIANLILRTLKSYPLMMLRHNALPPFIHPKFISSDFKNNQMEPLTNCISLVHMISHGIQGSRKLFWKNVRLECERLCEQHLKLDKWELLAAMLALSIYILIRLDEGETDYNNFDFLLLTTVIVIAKQVNRDDVTPNTESESYTYGLEENWKDWIFEESRRRLCVVYRVVNMLIYFEPAALCELQTDLLIAPLPAKKQLWEARDEFLWQAESEREPGFQTAFGLAASGDLVILEKDQIHCIDAETGESFNTRTTSKNIANWEEWCSGMDSFGGLVMLAASLTI